MITCKKERFGKFTKIKLINKKTRESASVIPEYGASLSELILAKNKKKFSIIGGNNSHNEMIKDKYFRSAKLTPFPNRINNGNYTFRKKKYSLPINFKSQSHAIHGFVYNKKFEVTGINESKESSSLVLQYDYPGNLKGYPFKFNLVVAYRLIQRAIVCNTTIKNTGKTSMPLGDGWHHYFKTNGKIDLLHLKVPAKKEIAVDSRMIPNGRRTNMKKFSTLERIGNKRIDSCFELSKKEGIATTIIYDANKNLTLCIWQETGQMKYNYLQVFTHPSRKSIAIEPMTCVADSFNNKKGLIILKPGQEFNANYGVYIE